MARGTNKPIEGALVVAVHPSMTEVFSIAHSKDDGSFRVPSTRKAFFLIGAGSDVADVIIHAPEFKTLCLPAVHARSGDDFYEADLGTITLTPKR